MICDCGAVQKLGDAVVHVGFDEDLGKVVVGIRAERLAPAADGLSAQPSEQMVAVLLLLGV